MCSSELLTESRGTLNWECWSDVGGLGTPELVKGVCSMRVLWRFMPSTMRSALMLASWCQELCYSNFALNVTSTMSEEQSELSVYYVTHLIFLKLHMVVDREVNLIPSDNSCPS